MVRVAFLAAAAKVVAAAIAEALIVGAPMPSADAAARLPADAQKQLAEYRSREATFKSGLTPPPGADAEERALYERRVTIERTVFSLFPRRDSAKVAAGYALDVDLDHGSAFIDRLLADLPVPWLAPYLNLVAAHEKICADHAREAKAQLNVARDGRNPLIRVAAEYLLSENACLEK
jgi:hypothetical protein